MELEQKCNHLILVDTHVHIYDCFNIDKLLNSAWNNFYNHADECGQKENFTGILLLTETSKDNWFTSLLNQLEQKDSTQSLSTEWTFSTTAETSSVFASNSEGKKLILIAGRQVITSEKLEVLALISDQNFTDGLSLEETIKDIQEKNGIAVLPWGVGKWLGKRGKLIDNLLQENSLSPVFLGDNSGRPQFWLQPTYFQVVKQQGWNILPGTDPLPLATEASRPGSFGLKMKGAINEQEPAKQLKSILLSCEGNWQSYGSLEKPWRFVRNQIAMRLK